MAWIAGQFGRVDYVIGGIDFDGLMLYPAHLFEANALIAQVQHMGMAVDSDLVWPMVDLIESSQTDYGEWLWRITKAVRVPSRDGKKVGLALPDVMMLCTYSLLGSYQGTSLYAQAIARLGIVIRHLEKVPLRGDRDVRATYAEWDEVLNAAGYDHEGTFDALGASLVNDADTRKWLIRQPDQVRAIGEGAGGLLIDACRTFLDARRTVVDTFLKNPEHMVWPGKYLRNLSVLPRPIARVSSEAPAEDTLHALELKGWSEVKAVDQAHVMGKAPRELLPGADVFTVDALARVTTLHTLADALFTSSPSVADTGEKLLKRAFGDRATMVRVARTDAPPATSENEGRMRSWS